MELLFRQINLTAGYGYRGLRQWLGKDDDSNTGVWVIEWNRETAKLLEEDFTIVGADGYDFIDDAERLKHLRSRIQEMLIFFKRGEMSGLDFLDRYSITV